MLAGGHLQCAARGAALMDILFLGALGLWALIWAFIWAMRSGQHEDLDGAASRILFEDDLKKRA